MLYQLFLLIAAWIPFVAARSCSAVAGYTIHGSNLGLPQLVPSATLCCSLCSSMPTCDAAVFVASNQTCQRKSSTKNMAASVGSTLLFPGVTTTPPPTTTTPPKYPTLKQVWTNGAAVPGYGAQIMTPMRGNMVAVALNSNGVATINGTTGSIISTASIDSYNSMQVFASPHDDYLRVFGSTFFLLDGATLQQRFQYNIPYPNDVLPPVYLHSAKVVVVELYPSRDVIGVNVSNASQVLWQFPMNGTALLILQDMGGNSNRVIAVSVESFAYVLDAPSGTLLFSFQVTGAGGVAPYGTETFFYAGYGNLVQYYSVNGSIVAAYAPPPGCLFWTIETGIWPDSLGFFVTVENITATDAAGTYVTALAAVSWLGEVVWIGDWYMSNVNIVTADTHGRTIYNLGLNSVPTTLTAHDRVTGNIIARNEHNPTLMAQAGNIAAFDDGVVVVERDSTGSQFLAGYALPPPPHAAGGDGGTFHDRHRRHP